MGSGWGALGCCKMSLDQGSLFLYPDLAELSGTSSGLVALGVDLDEELLYGRGEEIQVEAVV